MGEGKSEKGERYEKSKKTNTKVNRAGKRENAKQQRHLPRKDNNQKDLGTLLGEALEDFPTQCVEECDADKCTSQNCNIEEGKRELETFEKAFKRRLKDATSKPRHGAENLFHIMVKEHWPSTAQQKGFMNWMLQQREYQDLLKMKDHRDYTPIHNALLDGLEDFVNGVLEVEGLDIASILDQECATGNCLHLATKRSFSNLSKIIDKCNDDKDIFMVKEKNYDDTPLHIAVKQVVVPVRPNGSDEPEADDGTGRHGDSEHLQQHHEHDLAFDTDSDHDDDDSNDQDYNDTTEDNQSSASSEELDSDSEDDEETHERKELLSQILDDLDRETTRSRPPPRVQATVMKEVRDDLSEQSSSSASKDIPTLEWKGLPRDHSVRLLVEACPEALMAKNKEDRTPYQERENILLNDPLVEKLVKKYAEKEGPDHEIDYRMVRAKRAIVAEDPIAHFILSFCMRKSTAREDIVKQLYKPGQECQIEFDLDGMPTPVINHGYLTQLEKHLKFESILKYVALPAISVEPQSVKKPRSQSPSSSDILHGNGRSDLVAVFDWLWRRGVREIIKVIVIDNGNLPHADAAIVKALYGFKVEEWDWKKMDICSDVIHESSPAVREVSLYSSGNNAVLMGWASEEGLGNRKKFPLLQTIYLYVQEGLEDSNERAYITGRCKKNIIKHSRKGAKDEGIDVKIIPDTNPVKFSSELSITDNFEVPPWIKSTHAFSTFLMNASMKQAKDSQVRPVKIAIIDDGIDATMPGLQPKIASGATFCPYPHSSTLVNSYFVPRGKHGTLMAQLICDLCPSIQLYVARLEELPAFTGGGRRVTARSAAKAVEWAVSCGVDIISMSWTIQTTVQQDKDMAQFKAAIDRANTAEILMFCSASDQGANTKEICFPGDWNQCIRIGGATFTGEKLTWVNDDKADFWFPGRNVPFTSKDGKSVVYESGSSVATAAASGLAGVLIFSARLVHGNGHKIFPDRRAMFTAFQNMAEGSDGKFPRTDDVLNKRFKKHYQQAAQSASKSNTRHIDVESLEWNDRSKKALENLLTFIQGS